MTANSVRDSPETSPETPVRVGVVGLVHGHVHSFLQARPYDGVRVVGISERDRALARRFARTYDLDRDGLFEDVTTMLETTRPDAALVFTDTFDHRRAVEAAASRGIHVMVEKPLAVNGEHAEAIEAAARANDVHVLVNYETTWYPSTRRAYATAREEKQLGPIHKVIVRTGHRGPKEEGADPVFLDWLTDPKRNGGGALMDFGCYGANLVTWLMDEQRPLEVTARTQQIKTDPVYGAVDDLATIILRYPQTQGLIQASWNWPYDRKDLSVYGSDGVLHAEGATRIRIRRGGDDENAVTLGDVPNTYESALRSLREVVRGRRTPGGLSSLANNRIVTDILDAARRSAESGPSVAL